MDIYPTHLSTQYYTAVCDYINTIIEISQRYRQGQDVDNRYYVYVYLDPRTMSPFYIGKGTDNRLYVHLFETYDNTENKKKYAYITGLRNKGFEPIVIKIRDGLLEDDAYSLETTLIRHYGRKGKDPGGILTNICIDNRPPVLRGADSPRYGKPYPAKALEKLLATKAKIRGKSYEEIYGETRAKEIKEKLGRSGESNPFFGKKHSEEATKKMSLAKLGKPSGRKGTYTLTSEAKKKVQLNNPNRRSIHTPQGEFLSAEEYARLNTGMVTSNGLRNVLKKCDKKITLLQVKQLTNIFTRDDIGKTPRELGYYYL